MRINQANELQRRSPTLSGSRNLARETLRTPPSNARIDSNILVYPVCQFVSAQKFPISALLSLCHLLFLHPALI